MKKNHDKVKPEKKIKFRDILVVVLGLFALAGLIGIIYVSNMDAQRQQERLAAEQETIMEQGGTSSQTSTTSICLNEANASGWLEFYNENTYAVDLDGYTVSLNGQTIWTFQPGESVAPGAFTTVDTGGLFDAGQQNVVALHNAEGTALTQFLIPVLDGEESYARVADGGQDFDYLTATKGAPNAGANARSKQGVVFSRQGGFYSTDFLLQLTAPEGYSIYYTTDGTTPTEASSVYESPLLIQNRSGSTFQYADVQGIAYDYFFPDTIHKGVVVKAMAVNGSGTVSEVATQAYFVALGQNWAYADFPVLSIVADPADLFGYFEGIYVPGRLHEDDMVKGGTGDGIGNYRENWATEGWVEFYEAGKAKTYEGAIRLSIYKDTGVDAAQKSFRISMQDTLVSAGSSLSTFLSSDGKSLVLDAGRHDRDYKLREAVAYRLLEESSVGTPQLLPCNVFLNGEYWGMYMLQQNYHAAYINQKYGIAQDDVVLAYAGASGGWSEGDMLFYDRLMSYVRTNDLSVEENYDSVCALIDIESYLDYFCANMYLGNADYRWNSGVMWRSRAGGKEGYGDGRWRWLMSSVDGSMNNELSGKLNTHSTNTFLQAAQSGDELIVNLLANARFRQQLADKMLQLENGIFAANHANEVLESYRASLEQTALNSYKRFNRLLTDTVIDDEAEKIAEFFEKRGYYIGRYTQEVVSAGVLSTEEAVESGSD